MKKHKSHSSRRLIIVSYRLPFRQTQRRLLDEQLLNAGGLVSAIYSLTHSSRGKLVFPFKKVLWVGCQEEESLFTSKHVSTKSDFELLPVSIPGPLNEQFYGGFSNDLIWPLFHYLPSLAQYKEEFYSAYIEANRLVCEKLRSVIREDDHIWIHDYHFLMLPRMLRDTFPSTPIAFFLHIPFPSFEIFRLLPRAWRKSLIYGMLGADLVGFHTNSYAQHFLKSIMMILGYEYSLFNVKTPDRIIKVDSFPISIDYFKFFNAPDLPEIKTEQKKIRGHLGNRKIIFSVDRLDYTKGIHQRLLGYELFLKTHPEWQNRVVFVCVVVPSRDSIDKYKKMKREIEETIGNINGAFGSLGWVPINYQYRSLRFHELVALYSTSDIGLITPVRDGMNLVAKEYIASCNDGHGVLILSEMTGAAAELGEALIINPTDTQEIAEAIKRGLEMPAEEQKARLEKMQQRIRTYDVFTWAYDFFAQFQRIIEEQHEMKIKLVTPAIEKEIVSHYRRAKNRILFFDYDGTLVPFKVDPAQATPDRLLHKVLHKLSNDIKNVVTIVSGRSKKELDAWLDNKHMRLIAEHGVFIKMKNRRWKQFSEFPESLKKIFLPVLNTYVSKCSGAFIEEKSSSISWHYRNADPEYSFIRSRELINDLSEMIHPGMNVQILDGDKVIEVKRSGYNKGTAVARLLAEKEYDFVLAIGDDKTDEDMFRVIKEDRGYTIKVGIAPSHAQYNLRYQEEVITLLEKIVK